MDRQTGRVAEVAERRIGDREEVGRTGRRDLDAIRHTVAVGVPVVGVGAVRRFVRVGEAVAIRVAGDDQDRLVEQRPQRIALGRAR